MSEKNELVPPEYLPNKCFVKLIPVKRDSVNAVGSSIINDTLFVKRSISQKNIIARYVLLGKMMNEIKNISFLKDGTNVSKDSPEGSCSSKAPDIMQSSFSNKKTRTYSRQAKVINKQTPAGNKQPPISNQVSSTSAIIDTKPRILINNEKEETSPKMNSDVNTNSFSSLPEGNSDGNTELSKSSDGIISSDLTDKSIIDRRISWALKRKTYKPKLPCTNRPSSLKTHQNIQSTDCLSKSSVSQRVDQPCLDSPNPNNCLESKTISNELNVISDDSTKSVICDVNEVSHLHLSNNEISNTFTKPSISNSPTKPSISDSLTKASVSNSLTKPGISGSLAKPIVTKSLTEPSVSVARTKANDSYSLRKPSFSKCITKPSIAHRLTRTIKDPHHMEILDSSSTHQCSDKDISEETLKYDTMSSVQSPQPESPYSPKTPVNSHVKKNVNLSNFKFVIPAASNETQFNKEIVKLKVIREELTKKDVSDTDQTDMTVENIDSELGESRSVQFTDVETEPPSVKIENNEAKIQTDVDSTIKLNFRSEDKLNSSRCQKVKLSRTDVKVEPVLNKDNEISTSINSSVTNSSLINDALHDQGLQTRGNRLVIKTDSLNSVYALSIQNVKTIKDRDNKSDDQNSVNSALVVSGDMLVNNINKLASCSQPSSNERKVLTKSTLPKNCVNNLLKINRCPVKDLPKQIFKCHYCSSTILYKSSVIRHILTLHYKEIGLKKLKQAGRKKLKSGKGDKKNSKKVKKNVEMKVGKLKKTFQEKQNHFDNGRTSKKKIIVKNDEDGKSVRNSRKRRKNDKNIGGDDSNNDLNESVDKSYSVKQRRKRNMKVDDAKSDLPKDKSATNQVKKVKIDNWQVESIVTGLCQNIIQNETTSPEATKIGSNNCKLDFRQKVTNFDVKASCSSNESTEEEKIRMGCIRCSEEFYTESSLRRHMEETHDLTQRASQRLVCRSCFLVVDNLAQHMKQVHSKKEIRIAPFSLFGHPDCC